MIKPLPFCLLLILISGWYLFSFSNIQASEDGDTNKKNIDISLTPQDILFDINNMKPGDWASRTLTIKNSGTKDFMYNIQVQNKEEEKLFNQLELDIKSGEKELYKGKLAAFKSLPARELTHNTEEEIDITVRFPEHLGNDFQGLTSSFYFIFATEEKSHKKTQPSITPDKTNLNSEPPAKGLSTPNTATNIFNFLLLGTILILAGIIMIVIRHYKRIKFPQ